MWAGFLCQVRQEANAETAAAVVWLVCLKSNGEERGGEEGRGEERKIEERARKGEWDRTAVPLSSACDLHFR